MAQTVTQPADTTSYQGRHRHPSGEFSTGVAAYKGAPYQPRHRKTAGACCVWCEASDGYLVPLPDLHAGVQMFEHPHCRLGDGAS